MKILLKLGLLSLLIFTGCSNKQIKVVDENGKAIQGALVISEQPKYIMQSWKLSSHFTDKEGKAEVVSDRGYVFSKSHHIRNKGYLKDKTTLYSLGKPKTKGIKTKTIKIIDDLNNRKKVHVYPLNTCQGVTISFYPQSGTFIANSKSKNLIPSSKFYFEKGDIKNRATQLKSSYSELSFYCENSKNFSKIVLNVGVKPIFNEKRKMQIFINLTYLENISLDTYIEPTEVRPITRNAFYIRNLSQKDKPSVSADKDIAEKLKGFNKKLPEGNEHTQALFDYVLRAVELDK